MPEMPYQAATDLVALRVFVRSCASLLGLPEAQAEMLALAVNELATNTLQHTRGGGRVRVWAEAGQVICDVVDGGPPRLFCAMPPADSVRGRGLAIVDRIVDEVATAPVPDGTLVRMRMNL